MTTDLKQYKLIAREPTEEMEQAAIEAEAAFNNRNGFTGQPLGFEDIWVAMFDAAPDITTEAEKYMRLRLFDADNFDLDVIPVSREQIRALLRERGKV